MRSWIGCALLVLATGCTATGDWKRDSIFFSPQLAEQRLDQQRAAVAQSQEELARLDAQTASLQRRLRSATVSNATRREDLESYEREIDRLSKQLGSLQAQLAHATADRTRQAASLEDQARRLEARIDDMRRQLLVLLENT